LRGLNLVIPVGHVISDDGPDGEILHPLTSCPWAEVEEQKISVMADAAARELAKLERSICVPGADWMLVPLRKHLRKATVVGVVRLLYRAHTSPTSRWFAKQGVWSQWFGVYRELRNRFDPPLNLQHQRTSR
jgi:hypothetical protein